MTPGLPPSPFNRRATFNERLVIIAIGQLGVREEGGSNCGPKVEEYLASVNLSRGFAWCAAFVHWCCGEARGAGQVNPCPRTGGVIRLWTMAPAECIEMEPQPGYVFVLDRGNGKGHCGIVETVHDDGRITTIEGNTNAKGSREGDRVARQTWAPKSGKRGVLRGYLNLEIGT